MKTKTFSQLKFSLGLFGLLLLLSSISVSCKKEIITEKETIIYNGSLDKKIILPILDDHYGSSYSMDTTIFSSSVINFNKNDYILIDSIFFMISDLKTRDFNGDNVTDSISVELYNLTNSISIANSEIITDDINVNQIKSSANIKNFLPLIPINLGIRIINKNPNNCSWQIHAASLVLVRK